MTSSTRSSDFKGVILGQQTVGTWSLSKDGIQLSVVAQGQNVVFKVVELSINRLMLKLGKGKFLMKKRGID